MNPDGNVFYLFPEWSGDDRVPEALSPELRQSAPNPPQRD